MLFSALFQTIMEQFNPSLRNFIAMGKNYEKALAGEAGVPGLRVGVRMPEQVDCFTGPDEGGMKVFPEARCG